MARIGLVVSEQAAVDLERPLEQRLGLGVLPVGIQGPRLLGHGTCRLVSDTILLRHRGHPPQRLEEPLLAYSLEVLRPLDPRPQGDQFLLLRNRLVPAIGLQGLVDLLVQLLGSFLVVAGQLAQSRSGWLAGRR